MTKPLHFDELVYVLIGLLAFLLFIGVSNLITFTNGYGFVFFPESFLIAMAPYGMILFFRVIQWKKY